MEKVFAGKHILRDRKVGDIRRIHNVLGTTTGVGIAIPLGKINPEALRNIPSLRETPTIRDPSKKTSMYFRDGGVTAAKNLGYAATIAEKTRASYYYYKHSAKLGGYYPVIPVSPSYGSYPAAESRGYPYSPLETDNYPGYPTSTEYAVAYVGSYPKPAGGNYPIGGGGNYLMKGGGKYPVPQTPCGGYPIHAGKIQIAPPITTPRRKRDEQWERLMGYRKIRIQNLEHLSIMDPLEAFGTGISLTNRKRKKQQPKTTFYEYGGSFHTNPPSGALFDLKVPKSKPKKQASAGRRRRKR